MQFKIWRTTGNPVSLQGFDLVDDHSSKHDHKYTVEVISLDGLLALIDQIGSPVILGKVTPRNSDLPTYWDIEVYDDHRE